MILSSQLSSRKKSEKKLFVRLQTLLNKQTSLIRLPWRISFIHYFWRSIWIKIINAYTITLLLSRDIGLRDVSLWTHKNKKTSHKERLRTHRQAHSNFFIFFYFGNATKNIQAFRACEVGMNTLQDSSPESEEW